MIQVLKVPFKTSDIYLLLDIMKIYESNTIDSTITQQLSKLLCNNIINALANELDDILSDSETVNPLTAQIYNLYSVMNAQK
jgi:hypothetical protein